MMLLGRLLAFTGVATAFAPTDISGMKLWLDSRLGVSPGTYNNGIDSVADQSGSNNDATGTSPNRPVYIDAQLGPGFTLPSIYFPDYEADYLVIQGPDDPLGSSEPGIVCVNGYCAWVVFKTQGADTTATYAGNSPMTIVGNRRSWICNSFGLNAGNVEYHNYTAGWNHTVSSGLSLNNGNIHTVAVCHQTDGTVTVWADGTQVATASGLGYAANYIGASTIGYSYAGDQALDLNLGELMIWDGTITQSDIDNLQARAETIWGAV